MKYICGIDPGLSGAICLYHKDWTPLFLDMPVHEITKNGKKKRQLDLYTLGRFFDEHSPDIKMAIIEAPNAMPGQGVTSCFNFGFNCGAIQGIVAANMISMKLVAPVTWKKAMGLSKDKDASRWKASQIDPGASHFWSRVKDDGRAEAFLLAKYGELHVIS